MTVKELKKILKDVPDDSLITVAGEDGDGLLIEGYASYISYDKEVNQLSISFN